MTKLVSRAAAVCRLALHGARLEPAQGRVISPEVKPDRTIVFRLRAPQAAEVVLAFGGAMPMAKDGAGVWTAAVGPMEPEIYLYNFVVDGVRIPDPANAQLKSGRELDASMVEVPGSPPRFDELQAVPHGALTIRYYVSTPLKTPRKIYVYTPPEYDSEPDRRFPVLYLWHGSGDSEESWSGVGRAGVIMDNLIAQRKAAPLIVAMPSGDTGDGGAGGSSPEGIELIAGELMTDIVPMIERTYRVAAGGENRAIAGLSMGGAQAFTIGLKDPERFAWVGAFSTGLFRAAEFRLEQHLPGFAERPDEINRKLRMLFLGCGTEDPRYAAHAALADTLKRHGIRHVWYPATGLHEWKVWRHALAEFAQRVFQEAHR